MKRAALHASSRGLVTVAEPYSQATKVAGISPFACLNSSAFPDPQPSIPEWADELGQTNYGGEMLAEERARIRLVPAWPANDLGNRPCEVFRDPRVRPFRACRA